MKVVLTGATGFVGGALARRLAAEGVELHALTLPGSDRSRLAGVPVTFHSGDITTPAGLDGLFDGATWVIHAAGMLGRAGVSAATYNRINAEGVGHVLAAVERAWQQGRTAAGLRVLHVSSAGVLGPVRQAGMKDEGGRMSSEPPLRDSSFRLHPSSFDESSPLAPSNAYERSKALGEAVAAGFARDGLPLVVARPEFIYGPGDVHVLGLFRAIQRGLFFYIGDGTNTCHPTYVDDMVDGLLDSQGDLAGARPYYERALAIFERVLGPEHHDTAASLNNLGGLLQAQGDLAGARPYYERALAVWEHALGPDHPSTAISYVNVGLLLVKLGEVERGRALLEQAERVFLAKLGSDHSYTRIARDHLAALR